jgi:hypothetical protein
MSLYTKPTLHNGKLNTQFNPSDFEENNTSLTVGTADDRYLKLSGGTETGLVTFTNGLSTNAINGNVTFNQAIIVPSITFSSNNQNQTVGQLGYNKTINVSVTGATVLNNGLVTTPTLNVVYFEAGVWIISYYHSLYSTTDLTITQTTHGVTGSSSGTFYNRNSQSTFYTELIPAGSYKYITNQYIIRISGNQNLYCPIAVTYSTTGSMTLLSGISGIRIA